ncbi:right-handed parallel beta-helix repeat-containing protein [Luteolibacter soli]|uniref:Right-handed parallel beta-helix repeat-containing protein n=1 Tax=Luteolibacter soli TaxID=3135280 RepID=A0ABU9AZB2_9BACT
MKRLILLLLAAVPAFAQGPLIPPVGPPVPSMKTLDQIEARTPIESLPITISAPGSYYFTKNLQHTGAGHAITITSNNVTLDLGGFTLSSTAAVSGRGIVVNGGLNNITIRNGNITGTTTVSISGAPPSQTWTATPGGFETGLYADAASGIPFGAFRNMTVENLQVSGCRTWGIVAYYATVTNSSVASNGSEGLIVSEGTVNNCIAKYNGSSGISGATVYGSSAQHNGGRGIFGTTVTSSASMFNAQDGILASSGSVTACTALYNHASTGTYYDLNATDAVIASTKYGTGNVTGSSIDGERRTAIDSLPVTISTPGSYYFTKNLESTGGGHAITITSNNVTLDLGGFTLSSTAAVTARGIVVNGGLTNITIKNGNITGTTTVSVSGAPPSQTWTATPGGFETGLYADASSGYPYGAFRNMTVENLQVSGCRTWGIVAYYATVTNSSVASNGSEGLIVSEGTVTNCIAKYNGSSGISGATVTGSSAQHNGGRGMFGNTITSSVAMFNGQDGILASSGSVTSSTALYNHTSTGTYYDLNATDAVVALSKYGTGLTTGSTLTGNKTP